MKVVINKCYGGFSLSDKAIEACIALGMTVGDERSEDKDFIMFETPHFGHRYYHRDRYETKLRCDPRLVQVVEQLGEEANGEYAKLKVVEIPFEGVTGWHIDEYDGIERVEADHGVWG